MDDPSFAGSEKCTLCPAGTYSTLSGTTVTRFGSRFHSIYWALILRLEFVVDAILEFVVDAIGFCCRSNSLKYKIPLAHEEQILVTVSRVQCIRIHKT